MTQFFSVLFTFIFLSLNIKYVQGKSYCKNEFNSYEVGISQNFIGNKIIHYTIHKDWIRYYFNEYGVFCNKSISKSFNLRFGIDITDLSFSIGTKVRYSPYIGISKMLLKRNRLSIDTRLDLGFTNINVIYLSYGFAPNDLYPRIYSILGISFRFKLSEHFYLIS